ncbi:MAG: YdhR family protein [Bacteroidetes bacterium]|nr:YdhR family protein [Bacteroidota bacterium]
MNSFRIARKYMALVGIAVMTMAFQVAPYSISNHQNSLSMSQTNPTVVTITYVKKPWYAWRSLVVKKFKESIPEYEAIPGLLQKNYHFTENDGKFGGIYLWASEAEAKAWFNPKWFERVIKTYGEAGVVDYYQIIQSTTIAKHELTGDYWSVLQLGKALSIPESTPGLLRITQIKSKEQLGSVTLWKSKEEAKQYFSQQKGAGQISYFDTPVLIDKLK